MVTAHGEDYRDIINRELDVCLLALDGLPETWEAQSQADAEWVCLVELPPPYDAGGADLMQLQPVLQALLTSSLESTCLSPL